MSHLVETMFYHGRLPWHKLGNPVPDAPFTKEAIIAAGLDWDVAVQPLYTPTFEPMTMINPLDPDSLITSTGTFTDDRYEHVPMGGVVRRVTDGRMLGVVGPRWTPVQNRDAFDFFDPLVEAGLAKLHTAGSLDNGKIVWILAQIGNAMDVAGEDVGQFLLLYMGHGGKGVNVLPTPIRVVCANTLNMATRGRGHLIHHTRNAVRRLTDLRDFVQPYLNDFEETVTLFRQLAVKSLDAVAVDRFLEQMFPVPATADQNPAYGAVALRKRETVESLFAGDQIGDSGKRTAWELYSAVTEYVDHHASKNDDVRMRRAWLGGGASLKNQALSLLV